MKGRIGVIGLGAVGKAFEHTMSYFFGCSGYDIVGNFEWNDILRTDIVFICVQTPSNSEGRLDCDHVTEVLSRLDTDGYKNPIVIRSTLRIGYMADARKLYPELRLVYMPEFLRERSSLQWSVCPDRLVFSGCKDDVAIVLRYFEWVEDAEIVITDDRSAEIGKLAHNAFIATKVSFTNEIESICREHGADAGVVMDIITADRRVKSKEHLQPFMGPYGGKCVPKDTSELVNASSNAVLLKAAQRVNEKSRERYEKPSEVEEETQAPEKKATGASFGGIE